MLISSLFNRISGRSGGWWEFDARTAEDIETKYNEDTEEPKVLELLIAGLIFVIDLDAMVCYFLKLFSITNFRGMGPFTYYVITFCLFLDPLPPSVIKFGIG